MSALSLQLRSLKKSQAIVPLLFGCLLLFIWFIGIEPAHAHHPFGGQVPSNFIEGFLSGLGHPVIGIDHLSFTIAVGLLAALNSRWGMIIPVSFIVATALGTGIHLLGVELPLTELIIAASVLLIGIYLARQEHNKSVLYLVLAAVAGIFHGYAYGEAIFGAEMTPLGAYLLGFCLIQLVISAIAFLWAS